VVAVAGWLRARALPVLAMAVVAVRRGFEAVAVADAGRTELLVELAHEAMPQPDVGNQPDAGTGHG